MAPPPPPPPPLPPPPNGCLLTGLPIPSYVPPDAIVEFARADSMAPLMIQPPERPIGPSKVKRTSKFSSLSSLDLLPAELLQDILDLLDFQSISRFLRVSHRAKWTVERLPAYRELTRHASSTLIALGRTRTVKLHSAHLLRRTLRSEKCVTCGKYGPYLSLLTCERICWEEFYYNPCHWIISVQQAGNCFGLSPKDTFQIPILSTIHVENPNGGKLPVSEQLVSLKAARELAIAVHGSERAMSTVVNLKRAASPIVRREDFLTDMSLDRMTILQGNGDAAHAIEMHIGKAHTLFPSLSRDGVISYGYRCCGCWTTLERVIREGYIPFSTNAQLSLWRRTWSKAEFLEHVKSCEGMEELLSGTSNRIPQWMYEELRRWRKPISMIPRPPQRLT